MQFRSQIRFPVTLVLIATVFSLVGLSAPVRAQTGPGGVGDSTGATAGENLTVWLRSDVGVTTVTGSDTVNNSPEVDLWKDQSGEDHNFEDDEDNYGNAEEFRQPEYVPDALNGKPVLRFNSGNEDKKDILANSDSGVLSTVDGNNTFFIVSATREELTGSNNTWFQFRFVNANQSENAGYLGTSEGKVKVDKNGTGPTLNLSSPITDYHVFSSVSDNTADGQEDLGLNGTVRGTESSSTTTSSGHLEIGKKGTLAKLNFAEFIVFKTALNTAERRLVANYLAEKYGLSMDGNDYYRFGTGHPSEIVGIGRATSDAGASPGGEHTEATSSPLTIKEDTDNSNDLNDGEFVMMGHDGNGASLTTSERPNGNSNVQKTSREWRAEVTGTGSKTVDVEVDTSSLSPPSGYNDWAVYVDGDGDFTSGATYHDLDRKSGSIHEASGVTISDGDYVTVAAVKRVVNFTTTSKNKREDTGDSPNMEAQVELNFPHDSDDNNDVTVSFSHTGDIGSPSGIQDGGFNKNGSNDNGDYEADDGTGNDSGGTNEGAFAGDYRLSPSNDKVTITSGNSKKTFGIELDDDGLQEQSEKFEVTYSDGDITGDAVAGNDNRFVGTIVDDDNPNKIAYSDPNDNDGRDKQDAGYNETNNTEKDKTLVYEVALPDGNTGNSSPATKATYEVTGGDAEPDVDFKLVDGSNATKVADNFTRESKTKGTVTIPDGDQYSRFELKILDDDQFEASEDVTLELTEAQGGTIDGDDKTSITLTIDDDGDPKPAVGFGSPLFSSGESTDANLTVTLSETPGTDVTVTFTDERTGSASGGGTDYTFPTDSTLTIPKGNTSGTFTIPVVDDNTTEENETIDVRITDATNADTTEGGTSTQTTATATIIDDERVGSQGPGGVGDSETLAFWGKADGLESAYNQGDEVKPWPDSSGNGNNATLASDNDFSNISGGLGATFESSTLNGHPVLSFAKNDTKRFYKVDVPVLRSLPDANYALFGVSNYEGTSGNTEVLFDVSDESGNGRALYLGYFNSGDDVRVGNSDNSSNASNNTATYTYNPNQTDAVYNSFDIVSAEMEGDELDISYDGVERATVSPSNSTFEGTEEAPLIGYSANQEFDFKNDVAELAIYDTDLNKAQRNIVRNYLSAKYNVGLDTGNGAKDLYTGDDNANGDYDYHVIGIGRDGGGTIDFTHVRAEDAGVTLNTDAFTDGDYVMLGTQAEEPWTTDSLNYAGTGGVAGLAARPDSIWFVDVTGAPSFDVTFDLTALGFESRSREKDGYVLLEAGTGCTPSNNDCTWSDAGGSVAVNGDEVTFSGVSLSSGGHYLAIGTTTPTESPLLNEYARAVEGQAGTDGADEGWRYVGVPVEGATIDDLQPPLSTARDGLVGFGERDVWYWALYNGNQNSDGWTQFESGEAVPNGRGFIVNLSDDNEHPIDPTLWMDVNNHNGTPGANDVTVGDDTPSADTQLRTDSTWHLLANPYAVDYDLSELNLGDDGDDGGGGKSDFKSGVQLWDPYAGSYTTETQAGDDTDHIAPWEAFFVERNDFDSGANTQLTFGSSGTQSTDDEDFIGSKSRAAPAYREIDLRLIARDENGNERARDEAVGLYFHEDAGPGEDAYDLSKLMPAQRDYAVLGAVADDRAGNRSLWALHSRSYTPDDTVTVPLELQTDLGGSFAISAPNWTNVPDDWTVTLVDTKHDSTHAFGRDERSPYVFSPTKSKRASTTKQDKGRAEPAPASLPPVQTLQPRRGAEAKTVDSTAKVNGASHPRFRIRIEPDSEPPPVEMASMNAVTKGQSVQLAWTTAREQNNAGFYVEHQRLPSGDTTATPRPDAWNEKTFIEGAGTTQEPQEYSVQLDRLDYGRHAFRLRQVDTDGTAAYSDVMEADVRLDGTHAVDAPYPNPAQQQATLEVTVRKKQPVRVQLYDLLGRRVRTVHDGAVPAQETERIRVNTGQLASGAYFLRVKGEDFVETRRMTVVQ